MKIGIAVLAYNRPKHLKRVIDAIVKQGIKTINGMNIVGSDLRSSAPLLIAGIIAKGSSNFSGLEHLDRGYENFELKLKNLGVKIIREISKNTFEENEYKIKPKSENLSKLEAA